MMMQTSFTRGSHFSWATLFETVLEKLRDRLMRMCANDDANVIHQGVTLLLGHTLRDGSGKVKR
jgi:hypothetical protein